MTPQALAVRICVGVVVVVVLVGGTIWLALSRSSSADEKATTSRAVNMEQKTTITRNKTKIDRNTRKLNATLRCLATAKEPLRCVRQITADGRRGKPIRGPAGAQGLRGAAGARGTTGARGGVGQMGDRGETGVMGAPGVAVKGDKGEGGRDGVDGLNGADGPPGQQGPRGPAPAQIQTACPGPDGEFVVGFATDPDGDLTYSCP